MWYLSTFFPHQSDLGLRSDTYELSYNRACYLTGQGKLNEALEELQKAEGESSNSHTVSNLQVE